MVKLVFNEQGWERSVELNEHNNVVMVGRNADCAVQTSNASVSRVHAMIMWRDGKLLVQDPPNGRPTNGTKVDGMRLQPGEVLELYVGSELVCGNFPIRVVADAGEQVPRMGEQAVQMPSAGQMSPQASGVNPVYQPQMGYNNPRGNYQGGQQPPARPGYQEGRGNPPRSPIHASQQPSMPQQMPGQPPQAMPNQPSQAMPGQPSQAMPQQGPVVSENPRNKRASAPTGRGVVYASPHAQVQAPAMTSGVMPAGDEVLRLQDELATLRRELDEARSGAVSKDDIVKELQDKLDERDQILTDYERRNEYHETVVTGLKDMIDKLKEQLDHQKEQYQECRRDLVTAQDDAEALRMELSTLKETLESKGMATSNAETAINDLKVQLQQKNRLLQDLQRELDLAQFSCKEERENCERLKENVDTLNEALEESQRRNRDMKKVVEQHEVMFSELKGNLNDRAREIRQLQDTLRAQGGGESAQLMQELSQVRDNLNRKNSEVELLQKQLRAAEEAAADGNQQAEDLRHANSRIAELESQLSSHADAEAKISEMLGQISALEEERESLESALAAAKSSASSSGGMDQGMLERLRGLYQEINDVVSQWREDLNMLDSSIGDLQQVFVAYVRIDPNMLQGQVRARLENVLREFDPKALFEDIGNSLDASQNSLAAVKDKLRDLRGALQM